MKLEMQISVFSSKGNVIVIGDFNARTSDKDDFITNDVIQNDILREESEIYRFYYILLYFSFPIFILYRQRFGHYSPPNHCIRQVHPILDIEEYKRIRLITIKHTLVC